ncbi:MAG: protein kinase domain-containing protein [Polyangiaceae bacterium]
MQCPSCQTSVDPSQRFCPTCGTPLAPASLSGDPQGPPADPMLGLTLGGKYKVVRLLGEGGMGSVYEGEQQLGTTIRKVAVKTLHTHLSHDANIKARFEREVGTIAELEHPNTIQVYDFGSTPDGILYIVMEFLHGKSLADLLEKQGAMTPERTNHVLQQVCGSLEEAHGRGIVHRDLKPDNIVLVERAGKKDFVKVLDFGIAKRAKEEDKNEQKLTQQGMVLGTPPYMSPEQFTGQPIDARSDIYSLGVMAYEMVTGKLPFHANTAWEWATQHMTQPPIPIESLAEGMRAPPAMRASIQRALAKSPGDRFQTVTEFGEAFAGRAPMGSGTAPIASATAKQKTELGTPLEVAAPFGRVPSGTDLGMAAAPMGAPHGYTPASGNVAFPTPGGIPEPPLPESSGGGRKPLLVAAALIGIASVGAIVFAMKGGSQAAPKDVVFDNAAQPAPATSLMPAAPAADPLAATASTPTNVPALNGAAALHPAPHPSPTHSQEPAPLPVPLPQQPQPPQPPVQPQQPPGVRYDGPECQRARRLRGLGHPREAQSWALACIAKGGNPN